MSRRNRHSVMILLGAMLIGPVIGLADPPPVGAGIVATLQSDQSSYTNYPGTVYCPPCTTNNPPCMLPCYFTEGKTAMASFTFEVTNEYRQPRTFEFSSGQQFDIELIDETGSVVAAWSDDKYFTQALTSFTLEP